MAPTTSVVVFNSVSAVALDVFRHEIRLLAHVVVFLIRFLIVKVFCFDVLYHIRLAVVCVG